MSSKSLTALALGGALILSAAFSPADAKTVLRIQTSTQSGGFSFKYLKDNWVPKLEKMTDGKLTIEFLPIKSVMPHRETPDGVAAGVLSGDLTSIAYFAGRNPAFAILGDLIAGYDTPFQVQDFCRVGGGAAALQKLYDKLMPNKIHVVGCGPVSKEALVSKVAIRGVDGLKGVKIRSPEGLAAAVFRLAGASPVSLPFSEVFTSLEKGVVDAADASAYVNNDKNGFHQFTISKKIWNKLTGEQQKALQEWYYEAYRDLAKALDKEDKRLVERDKSGGKIEVINWAQADRDKFRTIAKKAWEETAAKSLEARAALDANYAYMKKIGRLLPCGRPAPRPSSNV